MNNQPEIIDDILVKYLLGEATPQEQADVQEWIAESDEHARYFEHFKLIWDESKKLVASSTVNVDDAWSRFMDKVSAEQETEQTPVRPAGRTMSLGNYGWMKAAAVLVMLIGGGWLYYVTAGPGSMITEQAGDQTLVANLPDGSTVTLNRNSSITYPARFRGNERNVTLHGEGFFNITPDKSKPFIIDADHNSIKVVGTSFNVKTNEERTEVIVETGIVEVAKQKNAIRVMPHEQALVTAAKAMPVKSAVQDELYNYYRTKKFVCNGTSLKRLVEILNEAYDTHISIGNPKLVETEIRTTFDEGSLDETLNVIKMTYGISVEKSGNTIILK